MKIDKNSLLNLKSTIPQAIKFTTTGDVESSYLNTINGPIKTFKAGEISDLIGWAEKNKNLILNTLDQHGALLFRGFDIRTEAQFQSFAKLLWLELLDYVEPSTPRNKVSSKIYTSTEYPHDQYIPQHNEQSYSHHWPQKIAFFCAKPSAIGGETPISDSRKIFDGIDRSIKEEFKRKGVMYVRNFYDEMDLSWQHVFQTNEKDQLEQYCKKRGIAVEWKRNGGLRTKQISQAIIEHPRTKEPLWFNQAHLFHHSNLGPEISEYLLGKYAPDELPRNAFFGDGTEIPLAALNEIRNVYAKNQLTFAWEQSDILILDNMLYTHGRNPFEGERKVLVAMAEPVSSNQTAESTIQANKEAVSQARRKTASFYINSGSQVSESDLKFRLAAAYRMMVTENLDEGGISGHITMRVPNQPNAFWVNPFGLLAEEVTPDNLIKVDKQGNVIEGDYPVNVAGFCIHAALHEAYANINCAVHCHSPWGTLFSSLGRKIEPVDQNCCLFFENHAVYDHFNGPVNDPEDALNIAKTLNGMDAIILKNHGAITCGTTIESAVMRMISMESAFRLNVLSMQLPDIKLISPDVARLTREWIGNDIGFSIEFNALLRKIEKRYPEFKRTL
ncbi:TauD/TfdA family dioxygenase [Mucilaginibacter angelicae]|uniref:TauD/TfdA family dioxygenase n=1 Tax=Mucilaginibacter angelicae TaxID=869718 RepID=A0ABV6KYN6_9SPHI